MEMELESGGVLLMKALFIQSIVFILFNFEKMPPYFRAAMVICITFSEVSSEIMTCSLDNWLYLAPIFLFYRH